LVETKADRSEMTMVEMTADWMVALMVV
jgi:hypothetical protein